MSIQCSDLDNMLDVVHGLVSRGLMFKADSETFVITLPGGF